MDACKARHALACVLVDAVDARCTVATRITMAFVNVNLAVRSRCAWQAPAPVASNQVFAVSIVLAGIRFTFVDLSLTQVSGVAGIALAGEGVVTVNAHTAMARIR